MSAEAVGRTVEVRRPDGSLVAGQVRRGDSFALRLFGLMGRPQLASDQGLWLVPCHSVHMFFMRAPLDVVFLDRDLNVVLVKERMRPWSAMLFPVKRAHSALELAPGTAARTAIQAGERLQLRPVPVATHDSNSAQLSL